MMFLPRLCLLLSGLSTTIGSTITLVVVKPTAVVGRDIFSTVSPVACPTATLITPQPSGARCGLIGSSDGTGIIISYAAGSPYVASLGACGQVCLTTAGCKDFYWIQDSACNLKNSVTFVSNSASPHKYYDAACFGCSSKQTTCSVVSGFSSPQPANAVCAQRAVSMGGVSLTSYTSGVYIQSAALCGSICAATDGCTNLYFQAGVACNLKTGVPTNSAMSNSIWLFYTLGCFTCGPVVYTSTSSARSTISTSSTISPTSSKTSSSSTATSVTKSVTSTSSSSSTTLTTAPWTWTSVQKNPASYNMAITTTYTQSPQCTEGAITMMDAYGPYLWANSVNPLPTSTVTSCYPSQFYSSIIGNLNSVKLPAFSALICPNGWHTYSYNTTYIGCCPKHFGLQAPNYKANPARPFSDAICTSDVGVGAVYVVSWYNSTSYWTEKTVTATAGTIVYADAFDGFKSPATVSAVKTAS